jgi:hypothetical protein
MATLSPTRPSTATRRPARRWADGLWWGVAVGVLTTAWLTRSALGPDPITGTDTIFHLIRVDLGLDLLKAGRLDGWNPALFLGSDGFLFYGPGFHLLVGCLQALLGGWLSTVQAMNLTVMAAAVALPAAVAFLARSFGLDRTAAGVAAAMTPLVSCRFGVGVSGLFTTGLAVHQVGALLWALGLGCWLRVLRGGRWIAGAALLSGLAAITHPVTAQNLGLAVVVVLAAGWRTLPAARGAVRRLAGTAILALGSSGVVLLPALVHHRLAGVATDWETPSVFVRALGIVAGDAVFPAGVGLAALGAISSLARRPRHPCWQPLTLAPPVLLAAGYLAAALAPGSLLLRQFRNRGLGFLGLLLVVAIGAAVGRWLRDTASAGRGMMILISALAIVLLNPQAPAAGVSPPPRITATAAALDQLVPETGRFAVVGDSASFWDVPLPALWLARSSGAATVNGLGVEITGAYRAADAVAGLRHENPGAAVSKLARLGVTHVVAAGWSPPLGLTDIAPVVWRGDGVAVLSLREVTGLVDPATRLTGVTWARVAAVERERFEVDFAAHDQTQIEVALAWSPRWRGTLDGTPVILAPTADGLIRFPSPPGEHHLALSYHLDFWHYLGLAISVFSGGVALVVGRRGGGPSGGGL